MSGEDLANHIRALLAAHPGVTTSAAGHAGYMERYRVHSLRNIGLETRGEAYRNVFVETGAIRMWRLNDIRHELYFARDYAQSRPNSNLFHRDAFAEVDIARFLVADAWQAARIIAEVAGDGGIQ